MNMTYAIFVTYTKNMSAWNLNLIRSSMFFFAKSEYCKAHLFDESLVKNVPPLIDLHYNGIQECWVLFNNNKKTYLYPMLLSEIADILLVSYIPLYLHLSHFFVSVRKFHCIFFSRHKISSYSSRHLLTSTKG